MPLPSKTNGTTHENEGLQHPVRVSHVFSGLQGFVSGSHALHGVQDCRASWGPCSWGSLTPQGVVGGTHCTGFTDTSSLKLQGEVGGWRWLSGVPLCEPQDTHPFDKLVALALSPPVRRAAALPVSRNNLVPQICVTHSALHMFQYANTSCCSPQPVPDKAAPSLYQVVLNTNSPAPTRLCHCEPQPRTWPPHTCITASPRKTPPVILPHVSRTMALSEPQATPPPPAKVNRAPSGHWGQLTVLRSREHSQKPRKTKKLKPKVPPSPPL